VRKFKALIVWGGWDGHEPKQVAEVFRRELSARGFEVEVSDTLDALLDKEKLLKRSADDAQADFQQEMQDLYSGVASKVYDVLASYAKQQGITLVLDVSQQQTPVLYAGDATNITKQIIDAYNVKSGVPAPPVAAPRPAAAH